MSIIEIPTAKSFEVAAARFLNHAWELVLDCAAIHKDEFFAKRPQRDHQRYWKAVQDSMLIALAVTHDGVDHLLKSGIAKKSPFLLLAEPPQKWVKSGTINFCDLKTLDSQDLMKVYDQVAKEPLPADFTQQLISLRRHRNRIIHSTPNDIRPEAREIVQIILYSTHIILGELSWVEMRKKSIEKSPFPIQYPWTLHGVSTDLNGELRDAIELLSPAEVNKYLKLDKKRRFYRCPDCLLDCYESERDASHYGRGIAQLSNDEPRSQEIFCIICNQAFSVIREECNSGSCRGDVLFLTEERELRCLTCGDFREPSEHILSSQAAR